MSSRRTLNRSDVQRLILGYSQFALRLIETIGKRAVQAERQLEGLAFKTVLPRLAEFLQQECRDALLEGFSHQDIGERSACIGRLPHTRSTS